MDKKLTKDQGKRRTKRRETLADRLLGGANPGPGHAGRRRIGWMLASAGAANAGARVGAGVAGGRMGIEAAPTGLASTRTTGSLTFGAGAGAAPVGAMTAGAVPVLATAGMGAQR